MIDKLPLEIQMDIIDIVSKKSWFDSSSLKIALKLRWYFGKNCLRLH